MVKDDCIFCKLASGEIPSKTIYEDEKFRAILDLSPATKGHALILPKNHATDLFVLPEEDASQIMIVAKMLAAHMKEKLQFDGLNVVQNNGKVAGQTVLHYHLHIIPRYEDDGQKINWVPGEPSQEELEDIRKQITE